jgi:DNA-directed RNA polymerase specialized sigma24 family protein
VDVSLNDCVDALRDCVEQLESRSRMAVDLQYRVEAGREAIAAALGMKPDGVKTLLRRVRQVLRECVERKLKTKPSD